MNIGSGTHVSPARCQAITWTNVVLLLTGPSGRSFSEKWIKTSFFNAIWTCACMHSADYRVRHAFSKTSLHDDVIKWKHFPHYWSFMRGIHRSPVNSPHKGQWRGALMFSLICVWINGWVNNREAGDLRRHQAHYDVSVMRPDATEAISNRHSVTSSSHDVMMLRSIHGALRPFKKN